MEEPSKFFRLLEFLKGLSDGGFSGRVTIDMKAGGIVEVITTRVEQF